MSYLKDFITQINQRNFQKFLVLWEEYCTSETVDAEEFIQLLKAIKESDLAIPFSKIVETALPLWETIQNEQNSYAVLRLLIDLQTTNSPRLADLTLEALKKMHANDPKFNERLRMIGLRNKEQFQGALSKYDLLAHMAPGQAVFHTSGWGTGEIIEVSFVREHLIIEFENVQGRKDLSFANAFKTLNPLPLTHFLARRFFNPDLLEEEGRRDPVGLVKLLLRDLGPCTTTEIKDELCELVIAEEDWTKWWQGARAKLKKDPMIEAPESLKQPFYLRKAELTSEDRLNQAMQSQTDANQIVQTTYNFVRDTPGALKNPETKQKLQTLLVSLFENPELSVDRRWQTHLLLEQYFGYKPEEESLIQLVQQAKNIERIIQDIDIIALKKRALIAVKEYREDWSQIFLSLLFKVSQAQIREYLLKELNQGETKILVEEKLNELQQNPNLAPDFFVWYFQKLVIEADQNLPYYDKEGQYLFFEAFLILFSSIENQPNFRDLLKKMYLMLSGKRYALVRQLLQGTNIEFAQEFLLLTSKCQTLNDHDRTILRSLVEVVHPSLAPVKTRRGGSNAEEIIWTTEQGYRKIQERIQQIGTIEMIENAKEIEEARALGDLRENSEFKFAQERRARLQSELKTLSDQLKQARIITKEDIHFEEIGVGSTVAVADREGKQITYSILGPWDANPDDHVLSFNSKFAQAMMGKKQGETFHFKDENFKILKVESFI